MGRGPGGGGEQEEREHIEMDVVGRGPRLGQEGKDCATSGDAQKKSQDTQERLSGTCFRFARSPSLHFTLQLLIIGEAARHLSCFAFRDFPRHAGACHRRLYDIEMHRFLNTSTESKRLCSSPRIASGGRFSTSPPNCAKNWRGLNRAKGTLRVAKQVQVHGWRL